jgi:type I restriction enzyme S subunit
MSDGQIFDGFQTWDFGQIIKSMQLGTSMLGSSSGDGLPLLKMGNLTIGGFNFDKLQFLDHSNHRDATPFILRKGDFLFNTRNTLDLVGKSAVWRSQLPRATFNSNIMRIKFEDSCDNFFLGYYFSTYIGWREFRRIATGTTSVAAIYSRDLVRCQVQLPPLPQQRKIARILTTVDNLIEQTEALIEKYKSIKQGMMHDLFTRGVDSSGQLRPPYEDAPELYKESELGWIPMEWEATELGNACTWSSGGTPSKCNISYWQGEVPWASPKDMKTFELSDTIDHVSEEGAQAGSRLLEKGTVLIVIRGMILAHTFPVAIVCRRMAFNQDMKALVCNPAFQHRFLAHWLVAHSNHLLRLATESTHGTKRFDLADLYKLPFPFPSTDEQTAIVDRLDAVDGATNAEGDRLRNLKLQKTGLMQDLLTGKVRVSVDEVEESNHPTESVSCGVGL